MATEPPADRVPGRRGAQVADDRASRHAVRIAYYAFFSVFPLLLAFVSIDSPEGLLLHSQPFDACHFMTTLSAVLE